MKFKLFTFLPLQIVDLVAQVCISLKILHSTDSMVCDFGYFSFYIVTVLIVI